MINDTNNAVAEYMSVSDGDTQCVVDCVICDQCMRCWCLMATERSASEQTFVEKRKTAAESREFRVKFQRLQQCSRFDSCDKLEEFESWYCGF